MPSKSDQVTVSDLVQIQPQDFEKSSARAIEDNINARYADKVIQKVGLCLGFYDLLKTSEGLIGHGTGTVNVHVEFRLVVFRPFKGEILQGTIIRNGLDGIRISMDFFFDIFVPAGAMFKDTEYMPSEDAWVWNSQGTQLFFDKHETVRFRVEEERWIDLSPEKQEPSTSEAQEEPRRVPYQIMGSMQSEGLGVLCWWSGEAEAEGEEV